MALGNKIFMGRSLVEIGVFSAVVNVLLLVSPLYMLQIYDRVLPSASMNTLVYLSLFAFGAIAVLGILEIIRSYYGNRVASRLDADVGDIAFQAALSGPRAGLGDVQPLRDLATLRGFIASRQIFALFDLPFAPLFVGILYFLHPLLFWITLGGAVLLVLIAIANQIATAASGKHAQESQGASLTLAQSFARGFETVRALGMQDSVKQAWGRRFAESIGANARVADVNALFGGFSRLLRMGLQMAILGVGAYLVLQEQMTAGIIFASSIISGRALQPLDQIIGGWRQIVEARRSWSRLSALSAASEAEKTEPVALPAPSGELAVENLVYFIPGSDPNTPLIKKVSFRVEPGESLAIIGPSRAGKSTLARLLVGAIQPHSGAIRLDGADLRIWTPDQLGAHLGYVAQDVELFPGTIADNVSRFDPARTDEKLVEAATRAEAHQIILGQRKGYLTEVGAGGARLSGGERQRVGLARAFYGEPRVLVLDEPNANLDAEGEQALERALAGAKAKGVTVVMVTHKPSIASKCDRILMLREGAIELYGPAADVIQRLNQGAQKPPAGAEQQAQQAQPARSATAGTTGASFGPVVRARVGQGGGA